MSYNELSVQEKISLKEVLDQWGDIAIERFRRSLEKVVYDSPSKRSKRRTRRLTEDWSKELRDGGFDTSGSWGEAQSPLTGPTVVGILLKFNLYGRFLDMGVGRNHSSLDKSVARQLKDRQPTKRRAKRWYSGTKGYEVGKLKSILAKEYGVAVAQVAESALTLTANIQI
ncbi:hypothetical protein [Spirosoma litoris]